MKKMLLIFSALAIAAFLLSFTIFKVTYREKEDTVTVRENIATCTGAKSCNACKNCKYCKYCSKDGGTCGVCK